MSPLFCRRVGTSDLIKISFQVNIEMTHKKNQDLPEHMIRQENSYYYSWHMSISDAPYFRSPYVSTFIT